MAKSKRPAAEKQTTVFNIRKVPIETARKAKAAAIARGITLQAYILEALERMTKGDTASVSETLQQVRRSAGVERKTLRTMRPGKVKNVTADMLAVAGGHAGSRSDRKQAAPPKKKLSVDNIIEARQQRLNCCGGPCSECGCPDGAKHRGHCALGDRLARQ